MEINNMQDKLIHEFRAFFKGYVNRFSYLRYLAGLGKQYFTAMNNVQSEKAFLVEGSMNKIWLGAYQAAGKVYFFGDSDRAVFKGLLYLLFSIFSGHTSREIVNADIYFMEEIDLYSQLPSDRLPELLKVLQRMKGLAIGYEAERLSAAAG